MANRSVLRSVAIATWLLAIACGDSASQIPNGLSTPSAPGGSGVAPTAGAAAIATGMAGAAGRSPTLGFAGVGSAAVAGTSGPATLPVAGVGAGSAGRGLASAGRGAGAGFGSAGTGAAGGTAGAGSAGRGGSAASSGAAGTYNPCPAAPQPCKILPFGDSITYGLGFAGSYRVELFSKAVMTGHHITFLGSQMNGPAMVAGMTFPNKNEGHSGWKIDQMLPLIPSPALSVVPDIILVMIGTNDIAQSDRVSGAPMRLGVLIDKLIGAAPNALIVVATLTPLGFSNAGVETYNAALPPVIKQRADAGKHVQLVDMYTGFPTSELADGVHPNQQGSARMAGVWYAAIGGLFQ